MNLLPFVMIIIIILGLFSLSQFENIVVQKKETEIYLSYFKGLRKARNKKEEMIYKTTLKKNTGKQASIKHPMKKSPPKYFRNSRVGQDKGRLNLSSLLKEPYTYPILETVFREYVKNLYGHAEFFPNKEDITKDLIKNLIESYKKEDPSTPFYNLTFRDSGLQEIFYKMVKGTQTYDLNKKEGYPPFGEMFTFENTDYPPINFHYANLSFLSILFGEQTTQNFIKLEQKELEHAKKKCLSPLKKSDLEYFLSNQMIEKKNQVLDILNFTYQSSNYHFEKYQDPETNITVKIR